MHNNFWPDADQLAWSGLGTSLVCVIAGDVSRSWQETFDHVVSISKHYRHVIFIEGNHEHDMQPHIKYNCDQLYEKFKQYSNITYLHKGSIILDNTAFIGCNGWWTFDFAEPEISREQVWNHMLSQGFTDMYQSEILLSAKEDAQTLVNIIKVFDQDPNIQNIVVVTHTSPLKRYSWIPHGADPANIARCGSSLLTQCLQHNTNGKIKTWCFGHVHQEIDEVISGIRFVCHPRGMPAEGRQIYYPKLIVV